MGMSAWGLILLTSPARCSLATFPWIPLGSVQFERFGSDPPSDFLSPATECAGAQLEIWWSVSDIELKGIIIFRGDSQWGGLLNPGVD